MIEKQAHFHAAVHSTFHGAKHLVGGIVPGHNIDFHVHVGCCRVDGFGHAKQRFGVVGEYPAAFAADSGHGGEGAVQADDG